MWGEEGEGVGARKPSGQSLGHQIGCPLHTSQCECQSSCWGGIALSRRRLLHGHLLLCNAQLAGRQRTYGTMHQLRRNSPDRFTAPSIDFCNQAPLTSSARAGSPQPPGQSLVRRHPQHHLAPRPQALHVLVRRRHLLQRQHPVDDWLHLARRHQLADLRGAGRGGVGGRGGGQGSRCSSQRLVQNGCCMRAQPPAPATTPGHSPSRHHPQPPPTRAPSPPP